MRDKVEWTRYEVLLPQPSYSKIGHTIEQMTSSRPMIRSILRSQSYARTVSVEQQDRKWTEMARAKHVKEKDPSVASFESDLASRRAEARKYPAHTLPFARRPPIRPELTEPKPEPTPHPKSTLPDLERRLARERRRAGQKPVGHPDIGEPDRYSETPVHRRFAERKVFALPPEVARERSIITSGRRFTWGGRHKLALPGFNPHRERQLREKVSKC